MSSSDVLFKRAIEAFQAGRLDDAERHFKSVLARQPGHGVSLNILGVLLASKQKYGEAEPYLRSAIKNNANSDSTFYNYGIVLKGLGRPAEALEQFSKALAINPTVAETWNNRGTVQNDLHRYQDAIRDFDRAITLLPGFPAAFCNKGKSLEHLKRYDEALEAYDQALALTAHLPEAWLGRGKVASNLKKYDEAFAAYGRALALKPDLVEAWLGRGNVFSKLDRHEQARADYEQARQLKPDAAAPWVGSGHALLGLKRTDEALAAFDRALDLEPDLVDGWLGRGNVLYEARRYDEALAAYDRVLAMTAASSEGWLGRGNALTGLKRYDEAFVAFDTALAQLPDWPEAHLGRGNVLVDLKRYDEALDAYDKALTSSPSLVKGWMGRGNAFYESKRFDQALSAYDQALAMAPDHAGAWLGRGNVLFEVKRYEEAVVAYDKVLDLEPSRAEGWSGRAAVFLEVKQYSDALDAYEKAFKLNPDLPGLEGNRLSTKMHLCDWDGFDADCDHLVSSVRDGQMNAMPFILFSIASTPSDQLVCAQRWASHIAPATKRTIWSGEKYAHSRIRLGYLSADFRDHAVAHLLVGMLEQHDRTRFEVMGLSASPDESSEMRKRIKNSFDQFFDVGEQSPAKVAELVREMEIDVLIDLMGFTQGAQPSVLASRPAPIQVSYLGYAGTTGTDFMDYIIADRILIPERQRDSYTEKVAYLPNTYMATDSERKIADRAHFQRADCGLPESGFVFCSFNNNAKITPQIFDVWMELLRTIPGSVLWLSRANDAAVRNLRNEAQSRRVDPDRIVFAQRADRNEDHLARLALADLALDTLPYNGHTTTSDALWTGLPVLTCSAETYASRVAASLLNAMGLPDLVTTSLEAYQQTAVHLARDAEKLASIRRKVADHRLTTPLFNTRLFTSHIESAFASMYDRYKSDRPPAHFAVENGVPPRIRWQGSDEL